MLAVASTKICVHIVEWTQQRPDSIQAKKSNKLYGGVYIELTQSKTCWKMWTHRVESEEALKAVSQCRLHCRWALCISGQTYSIRGIWILCKSAKVQMCVEWQAVALQGRHFRWEASPYLVSVKAIISKNIRNWRPQIPKCQQSFNIMDKSNINGKHVHSVKPEDISFRVLFFREKLCQFRTFF